MVEQIISGAVETNYVVDNNSYLMIVWGDNTSELKIAEYSEEVKNNATGLLDKAISINGVGKAVLAGVSSPLAQSMASKFLPDALMGRTMSSLYDVVKDGKISNREVAGSFINSCTNELDATAVAMGLPSASSLYEALMPDGSGIIATDFLNHFAKQSKKHADDVLEQENTNKSATKVLKLKIITDETESYSSELPRRRTEKGFNYVDYVNNEEPTFEFNAIIGGVGIDLYAMKDSLIEIRNSKIPFDVYINDKVNKKQYHYKNCLFETLNFSSDTSSDNTKNISLTLQPIPEHTIKTQAIKPISNTSTRKQGKSKKSVKKNTKLKAKVQGSGKKAFTWSEKAVVNALKDEARQNFKQDKNYNPLKDSYLIKEAQTLGTSLQGIGFSSKSAGSNY